MKTFLTLLSREFIFAVITFSICFGVVKDGIYFCRGYGWNLFLMFLWLEFIFPLFWRLFFFINIIGVYFYRCYGDK